MEAGSLGLSGNSSAAVSRLLEMQCECFPLPVGALSLSSSLRSVSEPMLFCAAKKLALLLPKVV